MNSTINSKIIKIMNCILPVLMAFFVGGIVIAAIGENPFEVYWVLISKALLSLTGFQNTLHYAGPMILTGLAIAITFKANIYNMGVEGSLLAGGFVAGILGAQLAGIPAIPLKFICLAAAAIFGMVYALISALLKVKFRANEMVITMMMNYALAKVLEYLATTVFRDTGNGYVCTPIVGDNAMFARIFSKSRLTLFFVIVILVLVIMFIVMKKSRLGYEVTAMGKNFEFAEATGMHVGKTIIKIMLISGALAGIAGGGWMLEDQYRYTLTFSANPGLGWDGMLIALLGSHDPIGILIAAIFYAALKTGADSINMYANVPKEIISLIQALIVLFLAVKFIHEKFSFRRSAKKVKEA
ncbi:MAG: ABC transporter permease [Lachnospiraceae bacterium]|nr:ABC transporter permease [Lachnospiraceae bacterium]